MKPARTQFIVGDCREVLVTHKRQYDLIFADPPFNIGHNYQGFVDKQDELEFIKFVHEWIRLCWVRLKPTGILCLHGPDKLAKEYLTWERDGRYARHNIAWCNWMYRFGQHRDSNWIDSRCHLLVYAKDPSKYTWNPDDVLVKSDRLDRYGDKRIAESSRAGYRVPFTVWGIPSDGPFWGRVSGNSEERRGDHPNQLPELYLERIIKAYTNKGDSVLDPFCGSGTTVVVANALDRDCCTVDISEKSIASAKRRLADGAVRVGRPRVLHAGMMEGA